MAKPFKELDRRAAELLEKDLELRRIKEGAGINIMKTNEY